jgi:Ca2+-binding EF-hand superfamily protein
LRFTAAAISISLAATVQAQAQPIPRAQFIADMDVQFRKMDADKNGQLTRVEIEQFQKLTAIAEAQARNRALFAHLDADKNGQLSPAEFAKATTTAPAANGQPMIARMDSNRDSQVNLIEHRTATLANFDRLDVDKDGVVTPAELKAGGIAPR